MQTGLKKLRKGLLAKNILFEVEPCQAGRTVKEKRTAKTQDGQQVQSFISRLAPYIC